MTPPLTKPGSRATRILDYLKANRRKRFRAYEIAEALGERTQPTANECARLSRRGLIARTRKPRPNDGAPITQYQHQPVSK